MEPLVAQIERAFAEAEAELADPAILADHQRLAEAGRHMGVTVHDHVIIGREGHVSLRAKGLI